MAGALSGYNGSRYQVHMAKRQLLLLLIGLLSAGGAMAGPDAVLQLLDKKSCRGCNLQGADLVYAELQSAQLPKAKLQGANLGRR